MSKEALKLALETLMYASYEDIEYDEACAAKVLAARDAIKEALAQPEQEPVALVISGALVKSELPENYTGHLYTTPPKPTAQNFCPRCGKRTPDLTTIHTCTPPRGLEMT